MNLYLLRHGIAVERGSAVFGNDADRPLTLKGERRLWRIANAMEALELSFDLILSSPLVRARQTAEIVAEAFNARKPFEFSEGLKPDADLKLLINELKNLEPAPESVLLVGHEPCLSELISRLVSGSADFSVLMKKGGLCKLSTESLKFGRCATLEWLLTPRQMAMMG